MRRLLWSCIMLIALSSCRPTLLGTLCWSFAACGAITETVNNDMNDPELWPELPDMPEPQLTVGERLPRR